MALIEGVADVLELSIPGANRNLMRTDIDPADAVVAHMKCKVRLRDYINGKAAPDYQPDPDKVSHDGQCLLGKWIYGSGRGYLDDEQFNQLCADHTEFHLMAAEIVRNVQADDRSAAEAIFKGEFQKTSRKVVQALARLEQSIDS